MGWYRAGAIALTPGSAAVVGAGTEWADVVLPAAMLLVAGQVLEISRAVSDTELLLAEPYAGAGGAGLAYAIAPTQGHIVEASRKLLDYTEQNSTLLQAWEDGSLKGKDGDQGPQGDVTPAAQAAKQAAEAAANLATQKEASAATSATLAQQARQEVSTDAQAAAQSKADAQVARGAAEAARTLAATAAQQSGIILGQVQVLRASVSTLAGAAQDAVQYDYLWSNAVERANQAGMVAGQRGFQRDTEHVWAYEGAAWEDKGPGPTANKADRSDIDALRRLINDGGDPADLAVPFVDDDGWLWGGFFGDGSLQTPAFFFQATDKKEFLVLDEDGWVLFDAARPAAAAPDAAPWAGKRYLLFGDSITQTGNVEAGDFGLGFRANWPQYAFGQLKMASLRNYARSGAAFREYGGQLDWQKISHQISTAAANAEAPDVIVVSAGTNDGTASLGTYTAAMAKSTLASLDRSLTIESMRWAFWMIRQTWPAAMCFAALPLQRADAESSDRQVLLDAIAQMAGRYGFILIDGHHESAIVKDFEVWNAAGRDLSDGLHPNPSGQQKQADLYVREIRNAINF